MAWATLNVGDVDVRGGVTNGDAVIAGGNVARHYLNVGGAGYVNAIGVGAVAGGGDAEALGMEVGAAHHTNVEELAVHRIDPFDDGVGHPQENQTLYITRFPFNHKRNLICENTNNLGFRI